jgi:hypothetical protein
MGIEIVPAWPQEYFIEAARGNIPGASFVHKFGRNDAVPNGSWAHVSLTPFAITNFRQSAVAMRVKAGGNAADTAAGAGAREVTIQGLDSNGDEASEAVATAGAAASSATTTTFWRVYRAWVSAAGTYTAANTGAVVIEDSGGGADFITIAAGEGQTQYAGYSIPSGKTGYLLSVHVTVDSNKTANVRMFTRDNLTDVSVPVDSVRLKLFWDGLQQNFRFVPKGPELTLSALTDIWFEAYGDGAVSTVTVEFEILLIDN